jgi:hypothetical protein
MIGSDQVIRPKADQVDPKFDPILYSDNNSVQPLLLSSSTKDGMIKLRLSTQSGIKLRHKPNQSRSNDGTIRPKPDHFDIIRIYSKKLVIPGPAPCVPESRRTGRVGVGSRSTNRAGGSACSAQSNHYDSNWTVAGQTALDSGHPLPPI